MAEFWKKIFRLRDKTAAELQVDKYYHEIGEMNPFKLAGYLDISVSFVDDLGNLVGKYFTDSLDSGKRHIHINKDMEHEIQENALHELIMHHIEHEGTEISYNENELRIALKNRQQSTLWWL